MGKEPIYHSLSIQTFAETDAKLAKLNLLDAF